MWYISLIKEEPVEDVWADGAIEKAAKMASVFLDWILVRSDSVTGVYLYDTQTKKVYPHDTQIDKVWATSDYPEYVATEEELTDG